MTGQILHSRIKIPDSVQGHPSISKTKKVLLADRDGLKKNGDEDVVLQRLRGIVCLPLRHENSEIGIRN